MTVAVVPTIHPDDETLSVPQVARELGISRARVYVLAVGGRLLAREIAGRLIVRREDLERFKADRAAAPRRAQPSG